MSNYPFVVTPFDRNVNGAITIITETAIKDRGNLFHTISLLDYINQYNPTLTGSLLYYVYDNNPNFTWKDVDISLYVDVFTFNVKSFIDGARLDLPEWNISELPMTIYSGNGVIPLVANVVRCVYDNLQIDLQIMDEEMQIAKTQADVTICKMGLRNKLTKSDFINCYNALIYSMRNFELSNQIEQLKNLNE